MGATTTAVRVPSAKQIARRRLAERVWIVLGFVWAIARVLVAKATVEEYGVNITVFALLEVVLAWPHSISAARVVMKLIDHDPVGALPWGVILAGTHIAPELYIAVAGSNMSTGVYVSLIVIVVGLGALAIVGIFQKVAAGRAQRDVVDVTVDPGRTLVESPPLGASEIDAALAALMVGEQRRNGPARRDPDPVGAGLKDHPLR